jgi:hypothetical protein
MRRLLALPLVVATFALPGCIIVADHDDHHYDGYGAVPKAQLDEMVASNTQNRIGEPQDVVLARFPADNLSLVHSSVNPGGDEVAVYRVYARAKNSGVRFERYLVFEGGKLALLTDDEDRVDAITGSDP